MKKHDKQLVGNVKEVTTLLEEAHKILEEMKGNKHQDMFIKGADGFLAYAMNEMYNLEEII